MSTPTTPPVCPYCGATAKLVDSEIIYGRSYGNAYVCANYPDCDTYVGCHGNAQKPSDRPKGTLANAELRAWRRQAHEAFDLPWKQGGARRKSMYVWLAEELGLTREECHIGLFDAAQCQRVVEVCAVRDAAAVKSA